MPVIPDSVNITSVSQDTKTAMVAKISAVKYEADMFITIGTWN